MATRKEDTASFVVRFTQKIYEGEDGQSQVQWRGNIRHVQGGDEKRFSEFEDVIKFIQTKLADLTINATEDKSPEEQKGILTKSFEMWKKVAKTYPKLVIDTIKDPKHQVENIQQQIHQVGDAIGQKLELDSWMVSSKADYKNVMDAVSKLTEEVASIHKKLDSLSKKD